MSGGDDTPATMRLIAVDLDEASIAPRGPDVEHERRIAIFDLLEENYFEPAGAQGGPYRLRLAVQQLAEAGAVEDVVAEYEAAGCAVEELAA